MRKVLFIGLAVLFAVLIPITPAVAQAAHSVTLSWTDSANPAATTYNVYRAPGLCSGTPTFSKLATGVAVKTYQDATVTPGNYCFQVTATFNAVESAASNTVNPFVPPFAPTNLTAVTADLWYPSLLPNEVILQKDVTVPNAT